AGKNISPATSLHPTRDLLFLWGGRLARPIFTLFMSIYLETLIKTEKRLCVCAFGCLCVSF
ncbi:hypothetical protein, partial [Fischerella sp.]|uniref:hypothetical protein n=1 Tax=Fischerella sp. TaxID=1191 RepID=UPI0025C6032F